MADFEINGVGYQSKLLDGETQTLVLKRLLPTFTALVGVADVLSGATEISEAETPHQRLARAVSPVSEKLADMRDSDVQFILNACLDVTARRVGTGTGWVKVRQNGVVQDQIDAKFITRLTIAWHVLSENFGEMLDSLGVDLGMLRSVVPSLG